MQIHFFFRISMLTLAEFISQLKIKLNGPRIPRNDFRTEQHQCQKKSLWATSGMDLNVVRYRNKSFSLCKINKFSGLFCSSFYYTKWMKCELKTRPRMCTREKTFLFCLLVRLKSTWRTIIYWKCKFTIWRIWMFIIVFEIDVCVCLNWFPLTMNYLCKLLLTFLQFINNNSYKRYPFRLMVAGLKWFPLQFIAHNTIKFYIWIFCFV